MYQWLAYAHIGSVLLFVLAHGASAAMGLRLKAEPSADGIKALVVLSSGSSRVMYPSLLLIVITGIWLGAAGGWWGRGWIVTALVILLVTVALMNLMGRQYHRIRVAPPTDPDAVRRLALSTSPWPITLLGLAALGFILWLMLFKPF